MSTVIVLDAKKVKRGSEEGTEVVIKYFVEEYVPKRWFSPGKWIKVEKQANIFFPKVTVESISDVKNVYKIYIDKSSRNEKIPIDEVCEFLWHLKGGFNFITSPAAVSANIYGEVNRNWPKTEFGNVLRTEDETTGEVWVLSSEEAAQIYRYIGRFYCPNLRNQAIRAWWELLEQLRSKYLEENKSYLDYLEKVGRYEELAKQYEWLCMPEKAGEIRRKKREVRVVQLDLNQLIRQLGERGFTITYHCSHCGAPLTINAETDIENIKLCSHCGSRIEAIDLARFIKSYLS